MSPISEAALIGLLAFGDVLGDLSFFWGGWYGGDLYDNKYPKTRALTSSAIAACLPWASQHRMASAQRRLGFRLQRSFDAFTACS